MKKNIRIVYQIFFVLISLLMATACKRERLDEGQLVFSMSDVMYKRCEFATAKTEVVKNEIRLFGKIARHYRVAQ